MFRTPLQQALGSQSASTAAPVSVGDYRATETAARFSDLPTELNALQNACGIYDLGFRARIAVKGEDRVRWMNGMVTNNIRDLAAGQGVYAFLLNPQGRILGDMYIFDEGDVLTVETDRAQIEKILATFEHFIVMDDVEIENVSERWTALGLAGPKSREILNAAGIETPEMRFLETKVPCCKCDCDCAKCVVVRGEDGQPEPYEIWLAPKDVYKTWKALIAAGAMPVGSEAVETIRVVAGIPLYGKDIRERDLPQETEQMRALNFNKGCYVGQEIVERIRSRGNVHRKFTGFLLEGPVAIKVDDKIISDDKEIGEITSVAILPNESGDRTVALGYIRREVGIPGRTVGISGNPATVVALPLEESLPGQAQGSLLQQH